MGNLSFKQQGRYTISPAEIILFGGAASAAVLYLFLERGGGVTAFVLGLGVVASAAIVVRYPLLGLAAIAVIIVGNVSDNLIVALGAPSIAKIMAPGIATILALRYLLYRSRPFFDPLTTAMFGVYLVIIALSVLYARHWQVAYQELAGYLKDIAFVLLTLALFDRPNALKVFTWSLLITVFLICLLGFYKYTLGDIANNYYGFATTKFDQQRFAGSLPGPNYFGSVLVFLLPPAVGAALFSRTSLRRILGVLFSIAFAIAVALTSSRGAVVAILVAFSFFLFILDRRSLAYLTAIVAVAALAVIALFSEEVLARFEAIFDPFGETLQHDISVEGRLASWTVAVHLFFDHPFIGVGAGNFNEYFQEYALNLGLIFRGEGRSAHSLYLEVLAELGVVGLTVFMTLLGSAVRGVIVACHRLKAAGATQLFYQFAAFGIGLLGYLVAMVFLHDAFPRLLWTVVAIAIALPRIAAIEIAARDSPR